MADEIHDVLLDAVELLERAGHSMGAIVDQLLITAANCAVEPRKAGSSPAPHEHMGVVCNEVVMCRNCFVVRAAEVHDAMAVIETDFAERERERKGRTNGN